MIIGKIFILILGLSAIRVLYSYFYHMMLGFVND